MIEAKHRFLKDANVDGVAGARTLRLTWAVKLRLRLPGEPEIGRGERGTYVKHASGPDEVQVVPYNAALYDAFNAKEVAGGKLLTEEEVQELIR